MSSFRIDEKQQQNLQPTEQNPEVRGKVIYVKNEPFFIKGVSYGAFRPDDQKREYQDIAQIEQDFALIAARGINTVRVPHTMPPVHLLDIAHRHGLYVMVGLSAEQYVGYLIDTHRKDRPDVSAIVREKVRTVAGHPALLCYAIGNEISASTARWLGRRKIERYLKSIYETIKSVDPKGIVTYVNYPSTEYLQLPFLDVVSFNVYLERRDRYQAYITRLQNIAGDRPLLMSEVGLDAYRNGDEAQAESLRWQIQDTFAAGCAGVVIFSWTDEWHRAGAEVEDWAFGLTRRDRSAKPSLTATETAFRGAPLEPTEAWPRISVVVCTFNGQRTIEQCLRGLAGLKYPNFEVIVVDDGSVDDTAKIARGFDVKLISIPNGGLSNARNIGWQAATGEIVAYLDDDAYPWPFWLHYLANAFVTSKHAVIGGPNIVPPGTVGTAACVNNAPGGPTHVLIDDEVAEHIPGCNMAIRRSCLQDIGGFDPTFRVAGDDVDMCWKLQKRGWSLGYCPGAMVWHHRRHTLRGYFKQQIGYGKAEALLERKWPDKYNAVGHATFSGRVYGRGVIHALFRSWRVYHGSGGFAPFQSIYERSPGTWGSMPMMPEWYLLVAMLLSFGMLGIIWPPLYLAWALAAVGVAMSLIHACVNAAEAKFPKFRLSRTELLRLRIVTAALHLIQPGMRLWGRLRLGLSFWRLRNDQGLVMPWVRSSALWTEDWVSPEERYHRLEAGLRDQRAVIKHGGDFDRWDLEVEGGLFGGVRLLIGIEDHGAGSQYVRVRSWPRWRRAGKTCLALIMLVLIPAALASQWLIVTFLAVLAGTIASATFIQCAGATAGLLPAIDSHLLSRRS
jgi:GT2 family glycosyltransferase